MLSIILLFAVPPTDHLLPLDAHVVGIVAQTAVIKPAKVVEKVIEKVKLPDVPKRDEPHKIENKRSQVLVFGASWCDACCKFDKALLADSGELTRGKDGDFILLDYENQKQFQGFLDWKVEKLPTFVIIEITDAGKTKEVARVVGYPNDEFKSVEGFKAWLKRCASAEWKHGNPVEVNSKETPNSSTVRDDILSRLKNREPLYDGNRVTQAHEWCHELSFQIVDLPDTYAFYTLKGSHECFKQPSIRLSHIAAHVPEDNRCNLFNEYFVKVPKKNPVNKNFPFMVPHELNAGLAGLQQAIEDKDLAQLPHELEFCEKFLFFDKCLIKEMRSIKYDELTAYEAFHARQESRLEKLKKLCESLKEQQK